MRFPGYWVAGRGHDVSVRPAAFDDTELSAESGWTVSHQNDDPDWPHGFVEPLPMLREVCHRLLGAIEDEAEPLFREGDSSASIRSAQDLARLVLRVTA
jgi:hypothetical protein